MLTGSTCFSDELKGKLNIDLNNLDHMTSEDLKSLVDCAVGQVRVSGEFHHRCVGVTGAR